MEAAAAEVVELCQAVKAGDVGRVRHLLAAAPDPAALVAGADEHGRNALHQAFGESRPNLELVRLLVVACPAAAAADNVYGYTPFHSAAIYGHVDAARLLLKAMPAAALVTSTGIWKGHLPLHAAARKGHATMVQLLLEAAPSSAAAEDEHGWTPLGVCCTGQWSSHRYSTARLLIAAPGQQPARLLKSLQRTETASRPLYADIASRYPLSPADWKLVPSPCPGLTAALPAVLARSAAEAMLLVQHLPEVERHRVRSAALCLHRAQAVAGLSLPQPLTWRILAAAMA